jgi:energy-coupling factor transport system ATP-binding protein
MNSISINNLDFSYKNKKIFENFNLDIKENSFLNIIGPNGSGKSTLAKILMGLLNYNGSVIIDKMMLNENNKRNIRRIMGIDFENSIDTFFCETVKEELIYKLENNNYTNNDIQKKLKNITSELLLEKYLDKSPYELCNSKKSLVAFASAVIDNPRIIILDEAFKYMDEIDKLRAIRYLRKLKNTTILSITNNTDEIIFGESLLILNQGKIEAYGNTFDIIQKEKLFDDLGLKLPFMADLSIKLKHYNLLNKMTLDMEELVNYLWK